MTKKSYGLTGKPLSSACVSHGDAGLGKRRDEQMEAAPPRLAGPVTAERCWILGNPLATYVNGGEISNFNWNASATFRRRHPRQNTGLAAPSKLAMLASSIFAKYG